MMRVERGIVLLTACAVVFAVLSVGSAHAQTFNPQPYLVFEVPPEPVGPPAPVVDLQDQFIQEQGVQVVDRWYFMNPVEKIPLEPPGNVEPITDPTLHYRWHTIDIPPTGTNTVTVSNQFADQLPWTIQNTPTFLLAPSSKVFPPDEPGPPPPGHHYDCYEVVDAPPADANVDLNDQFGSHGPTDVTAARYLCAPTVKTKDPDVFPIFQAVDGRDHLACYDLTPHPHAEVVNTRTQFTGVEPDLTQIEEDRLLCVPSKKTIFFEPQPYLVYEVPPEPLVSPSLVDLEDQFIVQQDVPVLERWFLMNPVVKTPVEPPGNEEPITDAALHYRWYTIDVADPGVTHKVRVTNQFGDSVPWRIAGAPLYLLAPTSKLEGQGEPGPPPAGQHYDCYEVLHGTSPGALVSLSDQFGVHGPTDVMTARYLCAPAIKTKDQVVYPTSEAVDGRDHLACYEIQPEPHGVLVSTRDQFTGSQPDETSFEDDKLLCVPSVKTIPPAVPSLAAWGIAALGLSMLLVLSRAARRRVRYGETA